MSTDDIGRRSVRSAAVLAGTLFLVLVVALASAFLWASRPVDVTGSFEEFVTVPDTPFTAVSEPATSTLPPYTIASLKGPAGVIALSLPSAAVGGRVLDAVAAAGLDPLTAQVVRTTQTAVDADGVMTPYITISLIDESGYFDVLGMSTDGNALWYSPPILQVPSDLSTGSTWESEGLTVDVAPFTLTGSVKGPATVADDVDGYDGRAGCVDLRTSLDQEIPGAEGYSVERLTTWCPGLGAIASTSLLDDVVTRLADPADIAWPEMAALSAPVPRDPGTVLPLPIMGAAVSRAPLSVPGALVALNSSTDDVVQFTAAAPPEPPQEDASRVLWLQHPGGAVLALAVGGDRILVTTSLRQLQSYDLAGRLRWSVPLPDVASGEPVVLGDTVAVALLDGTVRGFSLDSGAMRWTSRLSDVVLSGPVVAGDLIVVADTAGYVLAVEEDGTEAWSTSLEPVEDPLSAFDDGSVLIAQTSGDITLLDSSGDPRWSIAPPDGGVTGPGVRWGDVIALPTDGGLRGVAAVDGDLRWTLGDIVDAQVTSSGLVAAGDRVVSVTPDGVPTEVVQVREADGSAPSRLFLATLGTEWVAVSQSGAMTVLGVRDE